MCQVSFHKMENVYKVIVHHTANPDVRGPADFSAHYNGVSLEEDSRRGLRICSSRKNRFVVGTWSLPRRFAKEVQNLFSEDKRGRRIRPFVATLEGGISPSFKRSSYHHTSSSYAIRLLKAANVLGLDPVANMTLGDDASLSRSLRIMTEAAGHVECLNITTNYLIDLKSSLNDLEISWGSSRLLPVSLQGEIGNQKYAMRERETRILGVCVDLLEEVSTYHTEVSRLANRRKEETLRMHISERKQTRSLFGMVGDGLFGMSLEGAAYDADKFFRSLASFEREVEEIIRAMKISRVSNVFREFYEFPEDVLVPNLSRILDTKRVEDLILDYTFRIFDRTIPLSLLVQLKEKAIREYGQEIEELKRKFLPLADAALEKIQLAEEDLKKKTASSRHTKKRFEQKKEVAEEKLSRENRQFKLLEDKFSLLRKVHAHIASMERRMDADYKERFDRALRERERERWFFVGWLYDKVVGTDIEVAPSSPTSLELRTLQSLHQRDRELTLLIKDAFK